MQLKYTSLSTQQNADSVPEALTHRLTFSEVAQSSSYNMLGASALNLALTEADAAEYTLGETYNITLTAA